MFGFSIVKPPFSFTDVKTTTIPSVKLNGDFTIEKPNIFCCLCLIFDQTTMAQEQKYLRNSKKFKGFDALDNNSACADGAPGATTIIKKVNRHGLTLSWIKAHVVTVRKTLNIIHNTIQI